MYWVHVEAYLIWAVVLEVAQVHSAYYASMCSRGKAMSAYTGIYIIICACIQKKKIDQCDLVNQRYDLPQIVATDFFSAPVLVKTVAHCSSLLFCLPSYSVICSHTHYVKPFTR